MFEGQARQRQPSTERRPHRTHRYLVQVGWDRLDVHCPACLAHNDGWTKPKYDDPAEPIYSGGVIVLRHDRTGEEMAFACPCWRGEAVVKRWRGEFRMLSTANPIPGWDNPASFGWVLWDREKQRNCPQLPKLPPRAVQVEIVRRAGPTLLRLLAQEITQAECERKLQEIMDEAGVERQPAAPKLSDILGTALQAVYWPHRPSRLAGAA